MAKEHIDLPIPPLLSPLKWVGGNLCEPEASIKTQKKTEGLKLTFFGSGHFRVSLEMSKRLPPSDHPL